MNTKTTTLKATRQTHLLLRASEDLGNGSEGLRRVQIPHDCRKIQRVLCPGFRVQGSGLRVQGSGIKVQGSGSGFRVQGSETRDHDQYR